MDDIIDLIDEELAKKAINDFSTFIENDINAAIEGKANYLAALGLSVYTEYLGGLLSLNLEEEVSSDMSLNYRTGIKFIDDDSPTFILDERDPKVSNKYGLIYGKVRCGLVHQYFIKDIRTVWMKNKSPDSCGIHILKNGRIDFYVEAYKGHFLKARDQYLKLIDKDKKMEKYLIRKWHSLEVREGSGPTVNGII